MSNRDAGDMPREARSITMSVLESVKYLRPFSPDRHPREEWLVFRTRGEALAFAEGTGVDRFAAGRAATEAILECAGSYGLPYLSRASGESRFGMIAKKLVKPCHHDARLIDEIAAEMVDHLTLALRAGLASQLIYRDKDFFRGIAHGQWLAWRKNYGCAGYVDGREIVYERPDMVGIRR